MAQAQLASLRRVHKVVIRVLSDESLLHHAVVLGRRDVLLWRQPLLLFGRLRLRALRRQIPEANLWRCLVMRHEKVRPIEAPAEPTEALHLFLLA